jgi:hypothetical protein
MSGYGIPDRRLILNTKKAFLASNTRKSPSWMFPIYEDTKNTIEKLDRSSSVHINAEAKSPHMKGVPIQNFDII